MDRITRPSFLSITREIGYSQFLNTEDEFRHFWIDELGLCMKWIDSGIHHIEAKEIKLETKQPVAIHLFLRFDNGSTADIKIYTGAAEDRHLRIASSSKEILECNVPSQTIRIGRLNSASRLYFNKQEFDPAKSAEKAALLFLKSVQMSKETPYNPYDAHQLAQQIEHVEKRLKQFN